MIRFCAEHLPFVLYIEYMSNRQKFDANRSSISHLSLSLDIGNYLATQGTVFYNLTHYEFSIYHTAEPASSASPEASCVDDGGEPAVFRSVEELSHLESLLVDIHLTTEGFPINRTVFQIGTCMVVHLCGEVFLVEIKMTNIFRESEERDALGE